MAPLTCRLNSILRAIDAKGFTNTEHIWYKHLFSIHGKPTKRFTLDGITFVQREQQTNQVQWFGGLTRMVLIILLWLMNLQKRLIK